MAQFTIGETAHRSGFSASTLRYYEQIDLVAPAERTEAGYRIYDDAALGRLAFIARAKQLGCSLEDIRDLVTIWDDERCEPVQRRFHELVTAKLADARRQIEQLEAFTAQLDAAAARLAVPATDGPCGDDCACALAGPPAADERRESARIACTLAPGAVDDRIAEWRTLLAHVRARSRTSTGALRLELDEHVDLVELVELTRLVAAEQECCAFYSFAITVGPRGVALEVDAPEEAAGPLAALFGQIPDS